MSLVDALTSKDVRTDTRGHAACWVRKTPDSQRLVGGTCLNSAVDGRKEPNHWICCPRATALLCTLWRKYWYLHLHYCLKLSSKLSSSMLSSFPLPFFGSWHQTPNECKWLQIRRVGVKLKHLATLVERAQSYQSLEYVSKGLLVSSWLLSRVQRGYRIRYIMVLIVSKLLGVTFYRSKSNQPAYFWIQRATTYSSYQHALAPTIVNVLSTMNGCDSRFKHTVPLLCPQDLASYYIALIPRHIALLGIYIDLQRDIRHAW